MVPVGTVTSWLSVKSPTPVFVPICAACAGVTGPSVVLFVDVFGATTIGAGVPLTVQPVRPFSKSPFTTALYCFTVRVNVAVSMSFGPVPRTLIV